MRLAAIGLIGMFTLGILGTDVYGAPARPGRDLRQRLDLTDDQARRVEQIMANQRERTARTRIALGRARLDARELMLDANPDRRRAEQIARRIGDLQGQLVLARLETQIELKQVLMPQQWQRFQSMRERRMDGRRPRFR